MIDVLLADDQEMVRGGFRLILESQPDIRVVAEAGDGIETLRLIRETTPDVCLLDIRMPGMNGLELAAKLREATGPAPKIVIVTTFDLDSYLTRAAASGVSGFLLKHAEPALLIAAVRAAARGEALVSPGIAVRLLSQLRPAPPSVAHVLSDRERDVVTAVARGRSNTEISAELHLSLSTVKAHLAAAQQKVGVRNRVEIAVWAWRHNLVDDHDIEQ
jgi:DNA-binding NarL/FixJ family response regulator